MKNYIDDNGYILNLVVDATVDGETSNVGMISSAGGIEHVIFQADNSTSGAYTTFQKSDNSKERQLLQLCHP